MIEMFLISAVIAWVAVAPDKGTHTVTRGLFGGIRRAITGTPVPARKSNKTAPKSPKLSRRFLDGWREGVTTARARREAGRDLWSRGSRIAGRTYGGSRSIAVGARDYWRRNGQPVPLDDTAATVTDESAPEPEPARPKPGPSPSWATPDPEPTEPNNVIDLTERLKGTTDVTIENTELATIDQLDREVTNALTAYQDLAGALDNYRKWAAEMPDRWSGTNWGTKGLDAAVANLADVFGSVTLPDASEQMGAFRAEIAKARTLQEQADAAGAYGNVDSFRSE